MSLDDYFAGLNAKYGDPADEDSTRGKQYPKWMLPADERQRALLAVCGAARFQGRNDKARAKAILDAIDSAELIGTKRNIYDAILLGEVTNCIPLSYYEWRAKDARQYHWSVNGFLNALEDHEALMKHCRFKFRQEPRKESHGPEIQPDTTFDY